MQRNMHRDKEKERRDNWVQKGQIEREKYPKRTWQKDKETKNGQRQEVCETYP